MMNWPRLPLERVSRIAGGGTPSRTRPDYWGGEIPWITPTDLPAPGAGISAVADAAERITDKGLQESGAQLLPPGTVLFSSRATIGKIGIATVPLATNQGFANFTPLPGLESEFLAYALQFFTKEISALAGSITFKEVTRSAIRKFEIPLPPPSEQRRIVELLETADVLRKQSEDIEGLAVRVLPALFYKVFGDPATNPMGWRSCDFGRVILDTQYGTSVKTSQTSEGIPVIRMNNIDFAGFLDLHDLKYASLSADERQKLTLEPGDLLFNRTNSRELVGKTALWRGEIDAVPASYLIRIRIVPTEVRPEYVWSYLNTPFMKQILFAQARRAIGMANINTEEIRALPFIVPPIEQQERFVRRLTLIDEIRRRLLERAKMIESLFSTLLANAFVGDLTARWRTARMGELVTEMEEQMRSLNCSTEAHSC